jgi:hypothetical protein
MSWMCSKAEECDREASDRSFALAGRIFRSPLQSSQPFFGLTGRDPTCLNGAALDGDEKVFG